MVAEVAGALYFVLNVLGNAALVWKWRSGWLLRIVAILMQGAYAVLQRSPSFIANSAVFLVLNCYGWWKWRREAKRETAQETQPPKKETEMPKLTVQLSPDEVAVAIAEWVERKYPHLQSRHVNYRIGPAPAHKEIGLVFTGAVVTVEDKKITPNHPRSDHDGDGSCAACESEIDTFDTKEV